MPATVTEAYIMGVRDGREYQTRFKPGLIDMRALKANLEATMRTFSAGEVKEHLKGERDFWDNQIALAELRARVNV
jgi:hypothetical protein